VTGHVQRWVQETQTSFLEMDIRLQNSPATTIVYNKRAAQKTGSYEPGFRLAFSQNTSLHINGLFSVSLNVIFSCCDLHAWLAKFCRNLLLSSVAYVAAKANRRRRHLLPETSVVCSPV
jgi:hypothetical protein